MAVSLVKGTSCLFRGKESPVKIIKFSKSAAGMIRTGDKDPTGVEFFTFDLRKGTFGQVTIMPLALTGLLPSGFKGEHLNMQEAEHHLRSLFPEETWRMEYSAN
jgi:hypothetical protein